MALVEDIWFFQRLQGNEQASPWADMDWEADPDAEMHTAKDLEPSELMARFEGAVQRSRDAYAQAGSLDQLAVTVHPSGTQWNLRWIMIHMIEEYARHCGHADLIRQSIDGAVDD